MMCTGKYNCIYQLSLLSLLSLAALAELSVSAAPVALKAPQCRRDQRDHEPKPAFPDEVWIIGGLSRGQMKNLPMDTRLSYLITLHVLYIYLTQCRACRSVALTGSIRI